MNIGTNERPTRKAYVLRPHPELSSVIRQPNRHALTLFHDLGEASRHALRALLYRLKDSTISRGSLLRYSHLAAVIPFRLLRGTAGVELQLLLSTVSVLVRWPSCEDFLNFGVRIFVVVAVSTPPGFHRGEYSRG